MTVASPLLSWVSLSTVPLCSLFRLLLKFSPSLRLYRVTSGPSEFPVSAIQTILDSPGRCLGCQGWHPHEQVTCRATPVLTKLLKFSV